MRLTRFYGAVLFIAELLMLNFDNVSAGRVLYLAFPQFSHIQVMTCMTKELKQYGHELWIAYPDYLTDHPVFKDKDIHLIKMNSLGSVNFDKTFFANMVNIYLRPDEVRVNASLSQRLEDYIRTYLIPRAPPFSMMSTVRDIVLKTLSDTVFLDTIKEKNIDLVVVDLGLGTGYSIIPYRLNIPFCFMSIIQFPWQSATPTLPSFVPISAMGTTDNMTFVQRLTSMLLHIWLLQVPPFITNNDISTFAPEKPPITVNQLAGKSKMWFIAQDIVADFPRPLMPNSKLVGGLCSKDAKPLSNLYRDFLDKSKQGVVVVSFGGSVKELPKHLFDKLYKAFAMTDYNFIWRSNLISNNTSKFLMADWLPQNDLLGHSKTKLFITHAGANGMYESIFHGVPMLGVPLFAEQPHNAQKIQNKGYGLALDIHDNSAEEFTEAIKVIIQTPSYKATIMKASEIFRNRPLTPRQETAYWMDYLIKHGDSYIRPVGLDLPWYQYLCLDVLLFLFVIIVVILYLCFAVVRCCCRCMCAKQRSGKSKKD